MPDELEDETQDSGPGVEEQKADMEDEGGPDPNTLDEGEGFPDKGSDAGTSDSDDQANPQDGNGIMTDDDLVAGG